MTLEPVTAAMEVLRSGSRGDLNLRTRCAPEFRALAVRRYLELGDRIHADAISELLVHAGVGNGLSIDGEIVLIGSLSVERCRTGSCIGRCAGHGLQEAREIPAIERDIDDLPAGDDAGTFGTHGLQLHGFSFNRQRFRLPSDFEHDWRQTQFVVDEQFDVRLFVRFESGQFDSHCVCRGGQRTEQINARLVCDRLARLCPLILVDQGRCRAWNHGTGCVLHHAGYRTRSVLRHQRNTHQK